MSCCFFISLSTILIYIILKRIITFYWLLHCLSTILIYIILKRLLQANPPGAGLSTILIYIILKHCFSCIFESFCLSTILIYIILKPQTSNSKMTGLIKPNVLILKPLKYVILQQRKLPEKYYPKFPLNSPFFQKS